MIKRERIKTTEVLDTVYSPSNYAITNLVNRPSFFSVHPLTNMGESDQEVTETLFFAVASTSGRVVMYQVEFFSVNPLSR